MQATPQEIEKNRELWADIYKFHRTYYHAEDTRKFWDDVIHDAGVMCKRHEGDEFFANLIHLCVDDIEKRWKDSKQ